MACCALKLSQCVRSQIVYKYAANYSVVFNRYYCIKSENDDKHVKAKTEEEKVKDKLNEDVNIKEATKEHKSSGKQSKVLTEESKEAAKKKLLSLLSEVNVSNIFFNQQFPFNSLAWLGSSVCFYELYNAYLLYL
ncbi:uncharacterized protein LOC118203859, partial [Stegodyphus dumicola]|uniref:uncharacterized protein LOC118203859 n=1 Tax=Stegodyphus dumicola TaxID=202533 RepID=UPI0015A923CF